MDQAEQLRNIIKQQNMKPHSGACDHGHKRKGRRRKVKCIGKSCNPDESHG